MDPFGVYEVKSHGLTPKRAFKEQIELDFVKRLPNVELNLIDMISSRLRNDR